MPVNTGGKGPELLDVSVGVFVGVTETELDWILLPFELTAFNVIVCVTSLDSPVILIGLDFEPLDT